MTAVLFAALLAATGAGSATPPPADCSVVGPRDASQILGFPVDTPDPASETGGICFYPSRNISEDGSLTYAVVTADRLPQRRAFYRATARKCAPAVQGSFNEIACREFTALALAPDMDAYYAARAGAPDAQALSDLGDAAVQSGNAVYVHRGGEVFELSVLRNDELDLSRTLELAHLVLQRIR